MRSLIIAILLLQTVLAGYTTGCITGCRAGRPGTTDDGTGRPGFTADDGTGRPGFTANGANPLPTHGEVRVIPGAARFEAYLPLLHGKNIALVANHTSLVACHISSNPASLVAGNTSLAADHTSLAADLTSSLGVHAGGKMHRHLVDTLLSLNPPGMRIMKVFAPEHGFRGEQDAGAYVEDGRDRATGIPIVSLYGADRKPQPDDLDGVDLLLFDLQDVGARFYTYISSLHYVMEACAENGIPLVVLDRPNPNGGYVDGPLLEPEFSSFVGMHPIPVVYGLTIGELAGMINGEGWLKGGIRCDLTVIPCEGYYHGVEFNLPVAPSPNLASMQAIRLYPSTCFFEGTVISEGRGTPHPFEVYGHPDLPGEFTFTPVSIPGRATYPKLEGKTCRGTDLRNYVPEEGWTRLNLSWLMEAYRAFPGNMEFFTPYFEKLAGTAVLRQQIIEGWNEERIRVSWQEDLEAFRKIRQKYLLYP